MLLECTNCGKKAVDADEQVCTACGLVNEEVELRADTIISSTFNAYEPKSKRWQNNSLNSGLDALSHLAHLYSINEDIRMQAESLLKALYSDRRQKGKFFRRKEDVSILAGCCLVNVQQKCQSGVTTNNLCSAFKCSKSKVCKMMKHLKKYLVENSSVTEENEDRNEYLDAEKVIEDSVKLVDDTESLCSYVKSLLSQFPEDIKEELVHKTVLLTKLADTCWLLSGRSTNGVITAAAYLCWKSICPYLKLPLNKFCSNYGLDSHNARIRVPEIKSMLLKLGEKIPSVTKNYVTPQNLLFHLTYILENSETLRNDLWAGEFQNDVISKKEFELYRKSRPRQEPAHAPPSIEYPDDMNASDVEISDTEISSYIRTEEHVNLIKKLKKIE